jgi:D-alanine-D-alanine ligase
MKITVLFNRDYEPDAADPGDPGWEARADIAGVARDIGAALRGLPGARVELLPVAGRGFSFVDRFLASPPDLVFNLCESVAGDSRGELAIPAILDALGLPYTGSPTLALGLCLHKHKAKEILRAAGVSTPEAALVRSPADLPAVEVPLPAIVKPAREDASVGITRTSVCADRAALEAQVLHVLARHRQEALVERYVEGREIYVALLGNDPPEILPFTEIDFSLMPADRPRIVTYEAKWSPGSVEDRGTRSTTVEIADAPLRRRIEATARAAFRSLELRDYGRVDLRVSPDGVPFVIDVNPNCDLAAGAGFARAAARAGLSYDALARRLVEVALARVHADPSRPEGRPVPAAPAAADDRKLHAR